MTDEATATDAGSEIATEVAPANLDGENISPEQAFEAYSAKKSKTAESAVDPATAETESVEETDAAPEKVPGEDEAVDPAEKPPIERPKSWAKELDEEWSSYPREAQERIAKREQERDTATRRSQNEAAEERKAAKAEREQAEQARKAYEAKLPTLMQTLQDAQQSAFSDIKTVDDVAKMAAEDPFRYIQWQAHQTKVQTANGELQRTEGEKKNAEQKAFVEFAQKQDALFNDAIPEADKATVTKMKAQAGDFLRERGFNDDELNGVLRGEKISLLDHRVQALVLDAMKFRAAKAAPAKVIPKAVPAVQRPGAAPVQGAARAQNLQALSRQHSEEGTVDSAFAVYQARQRARA
jgi:hypothetical protein